MAEPIETSKRQEKPRSEIGFGTEENATHVVRQLRRDWSRKLAWRALWLVGVPTALAAVYFGLWASDQFESTAVITLQGADPSNGARPDSLLSSQSGAGNSNRELLAIREFILSRSMFEAIDHRISYVKDFQSPRWDMFARLSSRAARDRAFQYYSGKVGATFDSASGTLTISARAFDPRTAKEIAESILTTSEAMLATMVERSRLEMLRSAEKQATQAKEQLLRARRQSVDSPAHDGGTSDEAADKASIEFSYAQKNYESTLATLAEVRGYELRHPKLLVTLSSPTLPDESTYPRRLASVVTVFIFSCLIMGIGSLTVAAVREHVRI